MSSVPVLYHAESSFYSQRARLSFAEKGIRYKSHLINLVSGEVHEEWFLRKINPKGQVPAMEHLGQFYTDSRDIIEYVDTLPSDRPKLCPDGTTEYARKVKYYRDKIESINIPVVSFGSLYHRHLTVNAKAPSFFSKEQVKEKLAASEKHMASVQESCPDLKVFLNRRKEMSKMMDVIQDEEKVIAVLNDADRTLGEIEEELQKQKGHFGDAEYWLCGETFTIADIFLSCVLHRLTFVGQAHRLFISKRPLVTDYYNRVLVRKSFRKECMYANSAFWAMFVPMVRATMKKARPFISALSAVSIGVYVYYRRNEIVDLGNLLYERLRLYFW
ncbi:ganglioside-induced differentiation-associated protein 1-like [Lytechinus pictus]|uniref:ganglioside-induced differentiation-associated protein 1-like n=1 Tax=Lytechinus pictus TaxID=7653 RepID=UPI0030BA0026